MSEYKSIRVPLATWKTITRVCAETGEPRTKLLDRLASQEEARINAERQKGNEPND